jgi:integrase/recombinase XerD
MKSFESFLAPKLEEYIEHRLSLGYTNRNIRSVLRQFDSYTRENADDWDSFEPEFFINLRTTLKGEASTVNGVLSGVRTFFQFLVHQGHYPYNPLQDIPPLPMGQYFPFIFSSEKVDELLLSIQKRVLVTQENDLVYFSIYIAILLIARCGLRISEPARILLTHYRQDEGTIYIEKAKFQNNRLIPVPSSAVVEIDKFLALRKSLLRYKNTPYLLIGQKQKPLSAFGIYHIFHKAVKDIGVNQARRKIDNITFGSPAPHSLRHSFAVNTLKSIKERCESVWDALPILSVYMGHRNIISTMRYLTVLDAQHRQKIFNFIMSHQGEI